MQQQRQSEANEMADLQSNRLHQQLQGVAGKPPLLTTGSAAQPLRPAAPVTSPPSRSKQEGRKLFQCLATLIAGSIMAQSGMTLGWTSPMLPKLAQNDSFIPELDEEGAEASWITALMPLGAILGAVPSGKAADRIGRKLAIGITSIPFLVCWVLMLIAPLGSSIPVLYTARFIGGIGAGAACVLVPVYIGEVAEPSIRGTLGTFFPIFFSLGIVFSYVAGSYLTYIMFNGLCCLMLVPFLVSVVIFLPESPSWLVQHGRKADACRVLRSLRGPYYDVSQEIAELLEESEQLQIKEGGLRDLLGTKAGRKAIGTCIGLMWFQQMCGIDAVLFYTVQIFKDAGSSIDPNLATIIIGLIEVIMGIVVAVTIDRFGRKPLLVFSGSAMTVCLGIFGYYYKMKEDGQDVSWLSWLPLACIGMFNVVFSLGYGSVPYSIISELFPPETKGIAGSISIMTNWFLVFVVTRTFHILTHYLRQSVTFWLFSSVCAMSALFALVYVPETKGKTLHEIQTKLARRKKRPGHRQPSSELEPKPVPIAPA
ncbi:facilitated trehalose transporter Tret1-2 homolog [Copidosoma floridanum]|uniref:facilitated trehalose transporter Tret1-2 homolog n=1 Tax=Copidosoma floridanum TaxID=29053 RepID=UPI0006C9BF6A|nr:facilitated trehalose transporter Tret1-2 homolog [Copidosoma floridanum]